MKSYLDMVREFHEGAGIPVLDSPQIPDHTREKLRNDLIIEEAIETTEAIWQKDLIEVADGIADTIYVLCGTALEYGIPLDEVFAEVHRSNMTKLIDGSFRDDGKYLKGPSYEPPDIGSILDPDSKV
jgi:predicted HAD superfamily Cof-like phosphohydrolase